MTGRNTLDVVAEEVGALLAPLSSAFSDADQAALLLNALGWSLPPGVQAAELFGLEVGDLLRKLRVLANSSSEEEDDAVLMASRGADLLEATLALIESLKSAAQGFSSSSGLTLDYLQRTNIAAQLVPRLLDRLIIDYFRCRHTSWFAALVLVGIFEVDYESADPGKYQPSFIRTEVRYDLIPVLFKAPRTLFQDVYGWNTPSFDAKRFLANLASFLGSLGGLYRLRAMPPGAEEQLVGRPVPEAITCPMPQLDVSLIKSLAPWSSLDVGLTAYGLRATTPGGTDAGLGIAPFANGAADLSFPLSDTLSLDLDTTLDLQGGVALLLRPDQFEVRTGLLGEGQGALMTSGNCLLTLRLGDGGDPITILSVPGGSGLRCQKMYLRIGAGVDARQALGWMIEAGLQGAKFVVTAGEGDGFLQSVLPKDPMEVDVDLAFGLDTQKGLYIKGGVALEYTLWLNKSVGPVLLSSMSLKLDFKGNDATLIVGVTGALALGPVAATVQNIGLKGALELGKTGNLGSSSLNLGFKPPDGLGLSLDAGVVSGGGYLFCDAERGQYGGALQLKLQTISVTAIGLLNTKMPDGSPILEPDGGHGFSLLIIIAVTFPPIQLGFGFTLNGIGGLVGLNRTMNVPALRAGVKTGALETVLFPADPAGSAPTLVTTLSNLMPVAVGRFLIGPMVRIGWGTPPLLKLNLAVLIEIPAPVHVVIMGRMRLALPSDDDKAVVRINLDSIGILDFGKGEVSIDATIYDSRIATFTLSGDMALRARWKDDPTFALSVGGFHPAFRPPPGFPALQRLALSLSADDNLRLRLEAYLAVTSNTVQLGARLDLHAAEAGFTIDGMLAFDALIHLRPFGLEVDMAASVALTYHGAPLFAVSIALHLTGPSPWYVEGRARFKLLCLSHEVSFHHRIGSADDAPPPLPAIDVAALLAEEIRQPANWTAQPPIEEAIISLRSRPDASPSVRLHPLGSLTFRQRRVPLGLPLETFGSSPISGETTRFALTGAEVGEGGAATRTPVSELFAPAQFLHLSDDEKLSRPSFETFECGVALSFDAIVFDELAAGDAASMDYTLMLVDAISATGAPAPTPVRAAPETKARATLDAAAALRVVPGGPAALAPCRSMGNRRFAAPGAGLRLLARRGERSASRQPGAG